MQFDLTVIAMNKPMWEEDVGDRVNGLTSSKQLTAKENSRIYLYVYVRFAFSIASFIFSRYYYSIDAQSFHIILF